MQDEGARLPMDLIGEVIERCAPADMRNLLLVCKAWSRSVSQAQPRCSLLLLRPTALNAHLRLEERELHCCRRYEGLRPVDYETGYAYARKSLATPSMRDAVICGSGLEASAFSSWPRISCLQLCCMRGAALGSLRGASLRALRLGYVRFDNAGVATLCAGLASMPALEWLAFKECEFPEDTPGRALYDALACSAALRHLQCSGLCGALQYAVLPQLKQFRVDVMDDFESSDPPPETALELLSVMDETCADMAWLARCLTRNSSIQDLMFWSDEASSEFERAIESMTGVKRFTASTVGVNFVQNAAWKAQLTDACFWGLCPADTDVLPVLATHATQLTSLELHLNDYPIELTDVAFANVMEIGRCTALRTLRLCDPCRWIADEFIPALCEQVLPPLRMLTQLEIAPSLDWTEAHKARVQEAAACDVQFDNHFPLAWADWGRVPAEYRS